MKKKAEQSKFSKTNLPVKICENCRQQMQWRKRWEKVWDEVKYCSERCRRNKKTKSESVE